MKALVPIILVALSVFVSVAEAQPPACGLSSIAPSDLATLRSRDENASRDARVRVRAAAERVFATNALVGCRDTDVRAAIGGAPVGSRGTRSYVFGDGEIAVIVQLAVRGGRVVRVVRHPSE